MSELDYQKALEELNSNVKNTVTKEVEKIKEEEKEKSLEIISTFRSKFEELEEKTSNAVNSHDYKKNMETFKKELEAIKKDAEKAIIDSAKNASAKVEEDQLKLSDFVSLGVAKEYFKKNSNGTQDYSNSIKKIDEGLKEFKEKAFNANTFDDQLGALLKPMPVKNRNLIDSALREASPIRQYANVVTTNGSGEYIVYYEDRSNLTLGKGGEGVPVSNSGSINYDFKVIKTYQKQGEAVLPVEAIRNLDIDLSNRINSDFINQFAYQEGRLFANGTGANEPTGFLQNSSIKSVNSGSATTFTADALQKFIFNLNSFYQGSGVWLLNTNTMAEIAVMKDKNDRYFFGDLASPTIGQIKGRPIVLVDAMPDIAANATPIAYADLKKGYTIVDQPSSTTVTVNTNPMLTVGGSLTDMTGKAVSYRFFRHVGGDVVDPQAFVKMKIAE